MSIKGPNKSMDNEDGSKESPVVNKSAIDPKKKPPVIKIKYVGHQESVVANVSGGISILFPRDKVKTVAKDVAVGLLSRPDFQREE